MNELEICPSCRTLREEGHLASALRCSDCKGKGIRVALEAYICNGCGDNLCRDGYPMGLVDASVRGGYSSFHLFDQTSYTFSLCERCLREMFGTFKVPPTISGEDESYAVDLAYYYERCWQQAGGQLAKLGTGICNAKEHCSNRAEYRLFRSGYLTNEAVCSEHLGAHGAFTDAVPVSDLDGVPALDSARTIEHRFQIAKAFLNMAAQKRPGTPVYFPYLEEVLSDYLEREGLVPEGSHNTHGAFWVPRECRLQPFNPEVCWAVQLVEGTLYVGLHEELAEQAHPSTELFYDFIRSRYR